MTRMHSKERVMAARVSRRNPTHRLHARKAYHQELLRSRAVTNSPLKWSATSYALMVGKPCSSSSILTDLFKFRNVHSTLKILFQKCLETVKHVSTLGKYFSSL